MQVVDYVDAGASRSESRLLSKELAVKCSAGMTKNYERTDYGPRMISLGQRLSEAEAPPAEQLTSDIGM